MSLTHLIVDVSNVAWRAFHTLGDLKHGEHQTAITYGIFRDLVNLQDEFNPDRISFCFDKGESLRKKICLSYKWKRNHEHIDEVREHNRRQIKRQIKLLRTEYLRAAGFRNIFFQDGFEADDIIASLVKSSVKPMDEVVIVSNDKDLYQLLSGKVCMWDQRGHRRKTLQWFTKEYNLTPDKWPMVKAIGGCDSDSIPGLKGVGEGKAIQYVRGIMPAHHKAFRTILEADDQIHQNMQIVCLPFPGTPVYEIFEDEVTAAGWDNFCTSLGMRSLFGKAPIAARRMRKGYEPTRT